MDIKGYILLNSLSLVVIFLTIKSNYKNLTNTKYSDIKIVFYLMFIGYGMRYIILHENIKNFMRFLILLSVVIAIMWIGKSKEIFLIALKSIKTYVAVEAFVISTFISIKFISGVKTLTDSEYIDVVILTMILYYILEKVYYKYIYRVIRK